MLRRIVLLLIVGTLVIGCRQQVLTSDMAQRDANEIMVFLKRAGISYSAQPGAQPNTVTLSMAPEDIPVAAQLMARVGLPRPRHAALSDMLPKDSWMTSRNQENVRLAYGMGQDLSSTITQISGVRDARIHLALAQKNTIGRIETRPSASVLVRYDPAFLSPAIQNDIALLVANAVPGLTVDRVAVSMVPDDGDMAMRLVQPVAKAQLPGASAANPAAFMAADQMRWIALCLLGLGLLLLVWRVLTGSRRSS